MCNRDPIPSLLHETSTIATPPERVGHNERVNSQPSPIAAGSDAAFNVAILASKNGVESSYLDWNTQEAESLFVQE
jgi:hypothetical protein